MRSKEEIEKKLRELIKREKELTPPEPKVCPTCGKAEIVVWITDYALSPNSLWDVKAKISALKWVLEEIDKFGAYY